METMLAAVFKGNGVLDVEQHPIPVITKPDEVLLKVVSASICGSDLHVLSVPPGQYAKPGTILGHEIFGEIVELGTNVTRFKIGDRVAVDNAIRCGTCEYCQSGKPHLCPNTLTYGQTLDGGFAPYCVVREQNLFLVPPEVDPAVAGQTEPLACIVKAVYKMNPTPTDRILIYGMGPMGLTFLRVIKCFGVNNVAVCEFSESRRALAAKCGADIIIDGSTQNPKEVLEREWGQMCDYVIDAVGVGAVTTQVFELGLVKQGGTLFIFGQNEKARATIPPAAFSKNEITITGSYAFLNTFPAAIELMRNPNLKLEQIVTDKIELKDINAAFDRLRKGESSRVIVYPNGIE